MSPKRPPPTQPIQGAGRLAIKAVAEVTSLVESLHHTILRVAAPLSPAETRPAPGLTGFVYRRIQGMNQWVGRALDPLLGSLDQALHAKSALPMADAIRAALNGVMGDYLQASDNPLALPMTLSALQADHSLSPADEYAQLSGAQNKVVIFVHGLCMAADAWQRTAEEASSSADEKDLPSLFANELGHSCLMLNYNSGLHISENGRLLSQQLDQLLTQWPVTIDELVLVGHSMGGLVCRSACLQAEATHQPWRSKLRSMVFLGSPHHGAPLERAGQWVDALLGRTAYTAPFARLGKLRSAGITDLRFGNLLDADRPDPDRFGSATDVRTITQLPPDVRCFAIAGLSGVRPGLVRGSLSGDGLVPVPSALGRHDDPRRSLDIPTQRQALIRHCHHLRLLQDARVVAQIRHWLAPPQV